MRRHGAGTAAAAALALLALAGCGGSPGTGGKADGDTGKPTPAARDKGPACVGEDPGSTVHVLRGGGFKLPGGGGVQYADAAADGTQRTATLRDGSTYASGQEEWKVAPGAEVTVSGHAYAVRQVCAHRVTLEPESAEARTALAAAPASLEPRQGPAADGLCFTTNPVVLEAAAEGFPAQGDTLALLANGGVQRFPTGLSVTVAYVHPGTGTAGLDANCATVPVAGYEDVRAGDTVEFAGVEFEVADLTDRAVRLTRTSG
ncbi:hypothetical protein KQH42_12655 [Streptomyces sp. CHA1]|uniref:hypothetical protein n=1 Tax=Streptomyces TaxID=1883 RepID=UPI0003C2E77E|nr:MULTISPECIES: hypothetical protein [unclassified Streptomyces]WSB22000.1 hypothetical protein OHB02_18125 [Streptomyces albidoflavus]ESQ04733.1 Hypothetical protein B590_12283 [Streptomyces sp. PVA_94-07]MBT3159501.1 hypothetical protein [Streptomyces sp. G11C]MCO6701227.1 hypothetical protein [Streptomyces sp. CHB9.2]MCO6707482.1 hypothetical protein [Streptomyces sp. CHA3]